MDFSTPRALPSALSILRFPPWPGSLRFAVVGLLALAMAFLAPAGLARAHTASSSGPNPAVESLTQALVALHARYLASPAERARLASQLLTTAATRYQLLASLIQDNPGEVLRVALPATLRAALPSTVQAYIEEEVEAEGVLEVLHEDRDTGSRYLYFVDSAAERLSLHFAADPPELLTGARVRVRGVRIYGALALGGPSKGSVQTLSLAVPNTLGAQQTLVILVNFQDAPTEPFTPDSVRTAFFTTTSNFWLENSYQQTWLAGDVAGWFTIAFDSTGCDSATIANLAEAAAGDAGYTTSAYTHHVYVLPFNRYCGWGGLSTVGGNPSKEWLNGTIDLAFTAHELGHGLGLYHSHALDCGTASIGNVMSSTFPPPAGTCYVIEYGDLIDAIGSAYPGHYNAFQKERLGWLNAGASPPITTVLTDGTYLLETYERAGSGPKALKILKSTDPSTGRRTWYYVESRQAIGFDGFLTYTAPNVVNGVLIHSGSESSVNSSYLLDMNPASDSLIWDWLVNAPLVVGQSFQDPEAWITITAEWVSGTQASVTVSFEAGVTTLADMTVSPDQPSYTRNQSVSIKATVSSGGSPVAYATVAFTVTNPRGVAVTGTATTASNGTAVYTLRLKRQDPVGIYQVNAVATKNDLSGSATTSFRVQ